MFDFTKKSGKMITFSNKDTIQIYDRKTKAISKEINFKGIGLQWVNYTKYDKWILSSS